MQASNAQKKRQDEKNSKTLREIAAIPANRHCFECGQRGPTYVNITEGSFCCTSCSGIIRGLNPPHRVKSISMASFSVDELEKIRSLGNAENAKTWLGLYGGTPPAMTNKDDIQAFLVKKYEKKAWYVSPSELAEQERLISRAREISSVSGVSGSGRSQSSQGSKPSELDLFAADPFAPLAPAATVRATSAAPSLDAVFPSVQQQQQVQQQPVQSPPAWMAPPPPFPHHNPHHPQGNNGPPAHVLPVRETKAIDPFAPLSSADDSFKNFESTFNDLTLKPSSTLNAFGSPQMDTGFPKSATVHSSFPTGTVNQQQQQMPQQQQQQQLQSASTAWTGSLEPSNPFQTTAPMIPVSSSATTLPPTQSNSGDARRSSSTTAEGAGVPSAGDKYSALAELDELFHTGPTEVHKEGKPAWMPSGFSTGPPPVYTPAFPESRPANVGNSGRQPVRNGQNGGFASSLPKSNTLGAISDYGMNNPFVMPAAQSNVNLASNPFATSPNMPGAYSQQQQFAPTQPGWANPFGDYPQNGTTQAIPPRPTPTAQQFAPPATGNPNWNPFL